MRPALGIGGLVLSWSLAAFAAEPWTLERALQQALSGNPDARLSQQRIVAAQAGLDMAQLEKDMADPTVAAALSDIAGHALTMTLGKVDGEPPPE